MKKLSCPPLFVLFLSSLIFSQTVIYVESGKSIEAGLVKARRGDTVSVAPGIYKEQFTVPSGVALISAQKHKAIIDGGGRGNTVTMLASSSIDGFDIRNGTTGIVSTYPGTVIKNCRIYKNSGSAILASGNLPEISFNLLVFNTGSGIQASSISGGSSVIENNTIAFNSNNGISLEGKTAISIQYNIISENSSGALKISDETASNMTISTNLIFGSNRFDINKDSNIFADPVFTAPRSKSMDFSLKPNSPALGKGVNGNPLGASY